MLAGNGRRESSNCGQKTSTRTLARCHEHHAYWQLAPFCQRKFSSQTATFSRPGRQQNYRHRRHGHLLTVEIEKRIYLFALKPGTPITSRGKRVRLKNLTPGQAIILILSSHGDQLQVVSILIGANNRPAEAAGSGVSVDASLPNIFAWPGPGGAAPAQSSPKSTSVPPQMGLPPPTPPANWTAQCFAI